jgi:hypothetical protein
MNHESFRANNQFIVAAAVDHERIDGARDGGVVYEYMQVQ